ncbi:MAG: ferritin-like domain-containing protein [Candidatus Lokiarchaeota archaeon]|nr:ferritin-like domain-containing protein [Candidatus Lokiarchaeota archaeon]
MENVKISSELIGLLNAALTRELEVSVQYMLQHTIWAGKTSIPSSEQNISKSTKFVASHKLFFLPGITLKKIAITEMRHAEKIGERIIVLGGEIEEEVPSSTLGASIREILEIDRDQEKAAIELYKRIIEMATKESDEITAKIFKQILSDEKGHHKTFSNLLEMV